MGKLVLISVYGDQNIGDAAILSSALDIINSALYKKSKLDIYSADPKFLTTTNLSKLNIAKHQEPYGYAIRSKNKPINNLTKIIRFIDICFKSVWYILLGYINHKYLPIRGFYAYIANIKEADVVISIGGGYLRTKNTYKDYFGLLLTILPIYIARLYKKNIIFLPMSFGGFASELQKKISFEAIKDNTLFIRERISLNELRSLSKEKKLNIHLYPDLALFYKYKSENKLERKLKCKYIVLTAREWFDKTGQEMFEDSLRYFIEYVWESHMLKTVFIPMTWNEIEDNDRLVALRIQMKLKNESIFEISSAKTPMEVLEVINNSYVAICMRMHSAILATLTKTPFICISYEHKTDGFLKMLGLEKWNINITKVNIEVLKNKFIQLDKVESYKDYTNILNFELGKIQAERSVLVNHLSRLINYQ